MLETFHLLSIKKRLIKWGYWCQRIMTMGLDYSNKSLIAQLGEVGVIVSATTKSLTPHNPEAEEINELIERMAKNHDGANAKWAKVICIHYTQPEKNTKTKILNSGLSKRDYYTSLQDAQMWLSNQLYIMTL